MLAAIVLIFLMPAIFFALFKSRSGSFSIFFGVLASIAALFPLTIITGQLSQHFVIYSLVSLIILAFAEECFRFAGLRIAFGKRCLEGRANLFDFMLFGFGFGLLEFGLRIAATLSVDFQDCAIWELGTACSADFQYFIVIAAHALVLHVLLSAIYFPLAFRTRLHGAVLVSVAAIVHASANAFAIETAYQAESNSTYLYAIIAAIAVYVGSLFYAGQNHSSDNAQDR